MSAFYNEFDPFAAAWLANLMAAGEIAPGRVDPRSIADVGVDDLLGARRAHFFAGIGGWDYALRLAGWPAEREVWTGSCPCQPFSAAGKRKGFADERHLWPTFFRLIDARRPATVMGEQVAGPDGMRWLDALCDDMEAAGYAVRACVLGGPVVGAPHIRHRIYWRADRLADADDAGSEGRGQPGRERAAQRPAGPGGVAGGLADTDCRERGRLAAGEGRQRDGAAAGWEQGDGGVARGGAVVRPGPTNGFWRDADWLGCRDGKWRPVEPASQRMANGVSSAMERLRPFRDEKEKIANAAFSFGPGDEILRELRRGYGAETLWISLGGRFGFSEAAVLLAVVCEHAGKLGCLGYGAAAGRLGDAERGLRAVRGAASEAARPSQGRQHSEQRDQQLRNALSELSQESAPFRRVLADLAQFTPGPLAGAAPARAGRLRGYGNAIIPQVAAAFILATEAPDAPDDGERVRLMSDLAADNGVFG